MPDHLDLYETLDRICPVPATTCLIDLSKITDFDWDQVVFVKMTTATAGVTAGTGVGHIPKQEFEDVILFLEGRELSRMVTLRYHPEKRFSRTLFLDFSKTAERYLIFERSEAVFAAERVDKPA